MEKNTVSFDPEAFLVAVVALPYLLPRPIYVIWFHLLGKISSVWLVVCRPSRSCLPDSTAYASVCFIMCQRCGLFKQLFIHFAALAVSNSVSGLRIVSVRNVNYVNFS